MLISWTMFVLMIFSNLSRKSDTRLLELSLEWVVVLSDGVDEEYYGNTVDVLRAVFPWFQHMLGLSYL